MIGIGIVGFGYWGPNLLRNFAAVAGAEVRAVADRSETARASAARGNPRLVVDADAVALLARPEIDAVVIATPVSSHYPLACEALGRGKHVLVEKPLCRTSDEARDLIARARRADRILMVDHTFLFTGAVQTMSKVLRAGDLGQICYFDSMRVNLGLFQPDVNCLWDLAPHDLSILDHLIEDEEVAIDASGYCHVDPGRPDMVFLTIHYARNVVAHLHLSWMSPVKVRRVTVGGTEKMLVWDDLDQDQKIKIYDHGIRFQPEEQRASIIPEYRIGDIHSPRVSRREALAGVAEHFVAVVRGETPSVMDGSKGLRVVRLLERAQAQLDLSLRRISDARAGRPT